MAQFEGAFVTRLAGDVPLTPFHETYPNFGSGGADFGFAEPGADEASADIIRAYHAILPRGPAGDPAEPPANGPLLQQRPSRHVSR